MSDFEDFLAVARAENARTSRLEYAERLEDVLSERVSWRRRLSGSVATRLAAMTVNRADSSIDALPIRWTKILGSGAPIAGLCLAGYIAAASSASPASVLAPPPALARAIRLAPAGEIASPEAREALAPADLHDARIERRSRPSGASPPAKGEGTLEAELTLLREATAALHTNQLARALALVGEHERRFQAGVLEPEFAGQRIFTLVALGRRAEGCAGAPDFLAKHPKSPLAPEVRASCNSE